MVTGFRAGRKSAVANVYADMEKFRDNYAVIERGLRKAVSEHRAN